MIFTPYDPEKCITTITSLTAGSHVVKGWDTDTMFEAEYDEEMASTHTGVGGSSRLVIHYNVSGVARFHLSDYSPSNDFFFVLFKTRGQFAVSMVDIKSKGRVFLSRACLIHQVPPMVIGKSPGPNVWGIKFAQGMIKHAGGLGIGL